MANNIAFPTINLSVSLMPTSAFPMDARSLFTDMDDMRNAAMSAVEVGSNESSDSQFYFGELLTYKSPDSTEVQTYKVVNKPEWYNLMNIATLTPQQVQEVVERVVEDPSIVKLGNDINLLTHPDPNSGIVYSTNDGLRVNLALNSGLQLGNGGLGIRTSSEGNVALTATDDGLKGEFSWQEFNADNEE